MSGQGSSMQGSNDNSEVEISKFWETRMEKIESMGQVRFVLYFLYMKNVLERIS